ncbi:tetratricopeptide repeat-containing sensor histidine kinase [Hymenobacter ruricola]|uniref:histidine kinase n=1 Tax=Hymenobacter ruricola TaxID=2791023 RepID=A0ABS0IAR2_9BACT|nr:ATP-binding protein [Hymenobacter ruricola]MBF9223589.1 tetratricopeptide repeat protein [Hymenobacter ruricola]
MKQLITYALAICGLALCAPAWAAATEPAPSAAVNSLRRRLAALPADTTRVLLLDELCWQLSTSDLKQAIAYGQQGLALARRLRYRRGQLKCLTDLGNCAMYGSDFPGGTRYFLAALQLARQPPANAQIIGFAYNGLGSLHLLQKEYPAAQHYLEQALAEAQGRHAAADVALFASNLGNVLQQRRQYSPAGRRLRQALALYDSLGHELGQTNCLVNLALLASEQRQWGAARQYAQRTIALARAAGNTHYLGIAYSVLSGVEQAEGHWAAALATSRRGLAYARQSDNHEVASECYQDLAAISRHQGDFRQADAWQQRYVALHDSLVSTAKNEEIAALQVKFDTEQKESRIRTLTHQSQLHELRAAQQRSRLQTLLLLGTLAALLAGGGLLYLSQRRRRARALREERLRTRIAADLHDEVGTLLARVSMQADLLRQAAPGDNPALDRLLGNARNAAGIMRDIVWGIDAQADNSGALLDRMREHLDQAAAPAGLNTHLAVTGLDDHHPLAPELRQHLYLVFKEAVTNAVRHARGATDLWVTLTREAGELKLAVRDNGTSPLPTGRSGLGLRSMRQRAQALRGTLAAGAVPGQGFSVALTVPV